MGFAGTSHWERGKRLYSRRAQDGLCLWLHVSSIEWVCKAFAIQADHTWGSCGSLLWDSGMLCRRGREEIHDGILGE